MDGEMFVIPRALDAEVLTQIETHLAFAQRVPRFFIATPDGVRVSGVRPPGLVGLESHNLAVNADVSDRCAEAVAGDVTERIAFGLGFESLSFLRARCTEWPVDSFAGWHNDATSGSLVRALLIISLTRGWRAGMGGVTEFERDDEPGLRRVLAPRHNIGIALRVGPRARHRVTHVRAMGAEPRRTLTLAFGLGLDGPDIVSRPHE